MTVTTLKLPEEMLQSLRAIAALETLRRGCWVSWAAMVRAVVEEHLLRPNAGLIAGATGLCATAVGQGPSSCEPDLGRG